MTPYVVRQGDHLSLLALRRGFAVNGVWDHPQNAALKALRKSPNILAPGDIVYLPDPSPVEWKPVRVGATNRFTASLPVAQLAVTFSVAGKPLAGAACIAHGLAAPNGFTTDGSGKLSLTVPLTVQSLLIEFPSVPLVRRLRVGHLDPAREPSGAAQRLRALGYLTPRTEAPPDSPGFAAAVSEFQRAQGVAVTGTLDDATTQALEQAHGC